VETIRKGVSTHPVNLAFPIKEEIGRSSKERGRKAVNQVKWPREVEGTFASSVKEERSVRATSRQME